MTKAPIALQELRRRIYWKAKSEKAHRFWGIFVHVTRKETLEEAYRTAKRNGGAAGIDGQTFEAIETVGLDGYNKPFGPIRALDDLHVQMRANCGQRGSEFWPLIATVGEQLLKKGKHSEQGRHDENGSISILNVGRMDNSVKQQA